MFTSILLEVGFELWSLQHIKDLTPPCRRGDNYHLSAAGADMLGDRWCRCSLPGAVTCDILRTAPPPTGNGWAQRSVAGSSDSSSSDTDCGLHEGLSEVPPRICLDILYL